MGGDGERKEYDQNIIYIYIYFNKKGLQNNVAEQILESKAVSSVPLLQLLLHVPSLTYFDDGL